MSTWLARRLWLSSALPDQGRQCSMAISALQRLWFIFISQAE